MKSCPPSLIIKEMQIQTAVRYQLTYVRMAIIKRQVITNASEDVEGALVHCEQECRLV